MKSRAVCRLILPTFALLLALAVPAAGDLTYNRGGDGGGVVLVTESTLPGVGDATKIYRITNATNAADCAAGTPGSAIADCRWNGSAYEPIGVAASGLTNPLVSPLDASGNAISNVGGLGLSGDIDANGNDLADVGGIANSVVFVRDVGGDAGIDQTDILEAIEIACETSGQLFRRCRDVVIPEGDHIITATIDLSGPTFGPNAVANQGMWSLRLRGAGPSWQQRPGDGAGAPRCATNLRWDGASADPMIQMHGARGNVISDLCLHLDHDQDGATGTPPASHGILLTGTLGGTPEQAEVSQANTFERVSIDGFSGSWAANNSYVSTCIELAPSDADLVSGPPYATDVQIDDLLVSRSQLSCHRIFTGANGFTNAIIFRDSTFRYSGSGGTTKGWGLWAEDSSLSIEGGYSNVQASHDAAGDEATSCNNTEALVKIGSTSAAQPKAVNVAHHFAELDCGQIITTVDAADPANQRDSVLSIWGSTLTARKYVGLPPIRYSHAGLLSIHGSFTGARGGDSAGPWIVLDPVSNAGKELIYDIAATNVAHTGTGQFSISANAYARKQEINEVAKINGISYPRNAAEIQAAITACGVGSGTANQGCEIKMPRGTVDVSSEIKIGGLSLPEMQNGFRISGHGPGIVNSAGVFLAGTTLRWVGADGGTVMGVSGFNHDIGGFMIEGRSCVDRFNSGGPPQISGIADGLCDSDGATSQVQAGYGILQHGTNSVSAPTGKNTYEQIRISGVLDTANGRGWGFAFGRSRSGATAVAAAALPATGTAGIVYRITDASSDSDCDNVGGGGVNAYCIWNPVSGLYVSHEGQNDHTNIRNVQVVNSAGCLVQAVGQAIENHVQQFECTIFSGTSGVWVQRGGIDFRNLYIGGNDTLSAADAVGVRIDSCATVVSINEGSYEWAKTAGVFRAVKTEDGGFGCGAGNRYPIQVNHVRFQMQANSSADHYCIDHGTRATMSITNNTWLSNSLDLSRRCKLRFASSSADDTFVTMSGNRSLWNYGADQTDVVFEVSDASTGNVRINRNDRGRAEYIDADGSAAVGKDAIGLYVDSNNDGAYDAGEVRLVAGAGGVAVLDGSGNLNIAGRITTGDPGDNARALALRTNSASIGTPDPGECHLGWVGTTLTKHCDGAALTDIDHAGDLDRAWCADGEPIQIGSSDAWACMGEFDPSNDYGATIEIRISPARTSTADPEIGDDIEAALSACVDPTSALNIDSSGSLRPGCRITLAKGVYRELGASRFNVGTVAGDFSGQIELDASGSIIYYTIPAPSVPPATITPDTRGTCNDAAFGTIAVVTDAATPWDATAGTGSTTTANFCDGENWVPGFALWTFGGPAGGYISGLTVRAPTFIFDSSASDGREIAQRALVISGAIGATAPRNDGGIAQVRVIGGGANGSADDYQTALDIGGPLGGNGGQQAAGGETCEGVIVEGFDADFVSDTGHAVWVRNCADVALIGVHTEHGGRLVIGEDQSGETLPEAVRLISWHGGGCNNGPCFDFRSGQVNADGEEFEGDVQAPDEGNLARIGGALAAGVIFSSDGAIWRSNSVTDGQVLLGNIATWTQQGGAFYLADDNTTAGANPMIVADSGADIERISIRDFDTNWFSGADLIDLSARTSGSDVSICFDDPNDPVMGGLGCDGIRFADADGTFAASNIGAALEEFNDLINAGFPNGTGAKVHWSQILGVPAGFADGSDDGSSGPGYSTIDDEDVPLTPRSVLNLEGAGVTCADDSDQTTCTIPGGGASSSFQNITTPAGTSPVVADSATDTLTLSAGIGLTITGDSSADSIAFARDLAILKSANPALPAKGCAFTTDGTASSGGFICEGETADGAEQIYKVSTVDGIDSEMFLATSTSPITDALGFSSAFALFQLLDSDLTAIADLATTAHGRGLLDDADPAASRASIGSVIGANVQAWDADLDDLADGSLSGSKVGSGVSAAAITTGSLDLGAGTIRGGVSIETTSSTAHSLAAAEGQWLFADESGATQINLPAPASGASFCVYSATAQVISINPNASEAIVLNGAALAGGNELDSPGTAGDFVCMLSNGTSWYVLGKAGAWVDGGAS